jgi:hypothetical protein
VKATKLNFIHLAKTYLLGLGLLSSYYLFTYLFGFIAPSSNPITAESDFSYLHLLLSTFYVFFPIIAALADNYKLYIAMLGIAASRIFMAISGILGWEISIMPVSIVLYVLASFLCLFLAVENVSSRVTVEVLSFSSNK